MNEPIIKLFSDYQLGLLKRALKNYLTSLSLDLNPNSETFKDLEEGVNFIVAIDDELNIRKCESIEIIKKY